MLGFRSFLVLILLHRKCRNPKIRPRTKWIPCKKNTDCPPGMWCPWNFCAPRPCFYCGNIIDHETHIELKKK